MKRCSLSNTQCLTVLAKGVPQVVNGVLDGAFAGHPGLDSKSQGCQHA